MEGRCLYFLKIFGLRSLVRQDEQRTSCTLTVPVLEPLLQHAGNYCDFLHFCIFALALPLRSLDIEAGDTTFAEDRSSLFVELEFIVVDAGRDRVLGVMENLMEQKYYPVVHDE